jgi:hypothetical protein
MTSPTSTISPLSYAEPLDPLARLLSLERELWRWRAVALVALIGILVLLTTFLWALHVIGVY